MGYTEPVLRLLKELCKLPGIGEKTAERLAFHLLASPADDALLLAQAIRDLKEHAQTCAACYNISEKSPCGICSDPKRNLRIVCVVEQSRDVWTIEKSGVYRGAYHVLQGRLSPLDGVGPEQLTIEPLLARLRDGAVNELILATNPTAEGDATAYYIRERAASLNVRITRLARGLPAGSSLEFANRTMVQDALEGRKEL